MGGLANPTLVVDGGNSPAFHTGADAPAELLPNATRRPERQLIAPTGHPG